MLHARLPRAGLFEQVLGPQSAGSSVTSRRVESKLLGGEGGGSGSYRAARGGHRNGEHTERGRLMGGAGKVKRSRSHE